MYPSRDRGHPSGLMATGKPARGSTHGPGGPWTCGLMDTGEQAQGTTPSRVADTHGPSWARGNDTKDASLLGKACGHRVGSIPGSDGKVHRFEGRARPCALIDAPISRADPSIPEEGCRLGCASIPSSAGGPYSIAPMRDSLRALGVGVRHPAPPIPSLSLFSLSPVHAQRPRCRAL